MGQCFLYGNGSAGTGLTIVSGLTEPVKPKENMIWVKSDKAGKKYVFAETEPDAPGEGLIWFKSTAAGIMTSCRVYVDSAWIRVDASFFTGGKWQQFSWHKRYLVQNGVPLVAFVANGAAYKNGTSYIDKKAPTIVGTLDDAYKITLSAVNKYYGGLFATDARVSLSDFDKLSYIAKGAGIGYKSFVMLNTKTPDYIIDDAVETREIDGTDVPHDISLADYDANAMYVGFGLAIGAENREFTAELYIKDLWLE